VATFSKKQYLFFSYLREYVSNIEHASATSLNTATVTLYVHNDLNRVTYCIYKSTFRFIIQTNKCTTLY